MTVAGEVSDPAAVEFRLGTYAKVLAAWDLVRRAKGLSQDTWRKGPGMPGARVNHASTVVGGVLYVVGGFDPDIGTQTNALYAYRPK